MADLSENGCRVGVALACGTGPMTSLYGAVRMGPYLLFGEVAYSEAVASVGGAVLKAKGFRTELSLRFYGPGFRVPFGAGYGYPGTKGGEGASWSIYVRPRKGLYIAGYVDLYRSYRPSPGDRVPIMGSSWTVEGRCHPLRRLKLMLRARRGSSGLEGLRGELTWRPGRYTAFRVRMEKVLGEDVGYALFWEVRTRLSSKFWVECRWTTFDLPQGLRIYELGRGPRGTFPLEVWTDRGCRWYILLRWSHGGHILWFRRGRTLYIDGRRREALQVQWEVSGER